MLFVALGIGAGAVAVILLVLWIAGTRISRNHEATVSRNVSAPPEDVWKLITDPTLVPRWRKDVKRIDVKQRNGDRIVAFAEIRSRDSLPYRVDDWDPPHRLVTRIDAERRAFGGTWTWVLEPKGGGTALTITERGTIRPALFRFLARYVFGYEERMNQVLEDLEGALEEDGPKE